MTRSSGTLAPEVSPTVVAPSSHSSWISCGEVDQVRRPGAPASSATSTRRTELDELREPTTITTSQSRGDLLDHVLAVLRGVADVVAGRRLQQRQPLS